MEKTEGIDRERVQRICNDITERAGGAYPMELVNQLETEDGLKFSVSKGRVTAKMAGIEASAPSEAAKAKDLTLANQLQVLTLWGNAARRALK